MRRINLVIFTVLLLLTGILCILPWIAIATEKGSTKIRVLIVCSYHHGDAWSQDALKGFGVAMKTFGYFDTNGQTDEILNNDFVETSRVIVKLLWLDARSKSTKTELEKNASVIYTAAKGLTPDIIILADEEAGNYLGQLYINSKIPVVFWGFNESPVKFGLVDNATKPGHNVTGVYQLSTDIENLRVLQTMSAKVKNFAILADDSPLSQTHVLELKNIAQKGSLPLQLIEVFVAEDYTQWKSKVLELQKKADALYIVGFSNLKDSRGQIVSEPEVVEWYLKNSTLPEAALGYMVKMGLLCSSDDTSYKQGYEAGGIVHDILSKGANPATLTPRRPSIQAAFMVNAKRLQSIHWAAKTKWGKVQYFDLDKIQEID